MAVQSHSLSLSCKRVCNFLLFISSPILPRFRDIAGFLLRTSTQPLFHPNFGVVPLGLDCRCCGSEVVDPTIIIRVITFELTQHIYAHGTSTSWTDRQTDDLR